MKKYLLTTVIAISLICITPPLIKAVGTDLSASEIQAIISNLIALEVIPQNRIDAVNTILTQINNSGSSTPAITILSPNGGENWDINTTHTIIWAPSSSGKVLLEIVKGSSPYTVISSISISDNNLYKWTIPANLTTANDYRIRITKNNGTGPSDVSDNPFTVSTPDLSSVSCIGTPNSVSGSGKITWKVLAPVGIESVIPYTYSWSGTDNLTGTSSTITKIYTNFGSKTATVRVVVGTHATTTSCSATLAPLSAFWSCVANPSKVSTGNTVSWSAIAGGGTEPYTYTWSDNEGSAGTTTDTKITKTYNSAGNKSALLIIEDATGRNANIACNATVYDPENPPAVTNLTASCSSNVSTATKGTAVGFSANASGGDGGYTYYWSDTDGSAGDAGPNVAKIYTTTGDKVMTVKVTSGTQTVTSSCKLKVSEQTAYTNLTTSCSASPSTINPGQTITWTAHPVGGTGNYLYFWTDSDSSIGQAGQSVSKVYNSIGEKIAVLMVVSPGTVSGNVLASANCSANVESPTSTTTNDNALSVSCSVSPSSVATNEILTLTATPRGGTGNYTYLWSDNQATLGPTSQIVTNISYPLSGTKNFIVQVTSGNETATSSCSAIVE